MKQYSVVYRENGQEKTATVVAANETKAKKAFSVKFQEVPAQDVLSITHSSSNKSETMSSGQVPVSEKKSISEIAKLVVQWALYAWSAIMLFFGFDHWLSTMGVVYGTELSMQITILSCLAMMMVWFALFGVWFSLAASKARKSEQG